MEKYNSICKLTLFISIVWLGMILSLIYLFPEHASVLWLGTLLIPLAFLIILESDDSGGKK